MKYVLLQMPDREIKIIDNSSNLGKRRVEELCMEGATPAGTIESDLNRLRLETGRTHQIRVHMAYLGHPVRGTRFMGPESRIWA